MADLAAINTRGDDHKSTPTRLGEIDFGHLALTSGLEVYKFASSMAAERHRHRIRAHYDGGLRSGVNKTPTFFINDHKYEGVVEADAIVAAARALAAD